MTEYITKDSGKREEFSTGARRDVQDGKVRFALIPIGPTEREAALYTRGAAKYGDFNWAKGMPFSRVLDSLMRHLHAWRKGERDEDHLAAVVFNTKALMYYEDAIRDGTLPAELDDVTPKWTAKCANHGAFAIYRERMRRHCVPQPEAGGVELPSPGAVPASGPRESE